ncbi:MAG TPA: hypothetical protein VGU71_18820 [Candidatus Dormibacteraeota bacterium]|nr:hypothetical protein [Candidatus Dormibacteraeota bacterium]
MEAYVAPYVQVRHAIHLLYATSPRSRDDAPDHVEDSDSRGALVLTGGLRARAEDRRRLALTSTTFASDLWRRAASMNHRFDKLGNPMPLELHGCGCGLCAKQQRQLRQFWEAR